MTWASKGIIDTVLDAEEGSETNGAESIQELDGNESEDSDMMPELESIPDDEIDCEDDKVLIRIISLERADPDHILSITDVDIMVFPDTTIRIDKETGALVKVRQILNGPIHQTILWQGPAS